MKKNQSVLLVSWEMFFTNVDESALIKICKSYSNQSTFNVSSNSVFYKLSKPQIHTRDSMQKAHLLLDEFCQSLAQIHKCNFEFINLHFHILV